MAEGLPSNIETTFCIKKKLYRVVLSPTDLQWSQENKDEHVTVAISEILSCQVNSTGKAKGWTLSFVVHKKGGDLKRSEVIFEGPEDQANMMVTRIRETIKLLPNRPQNTLVFVNPISGFKKGEKVFHEKIEPLFLEAGIKLEVHVTQKAHHTEEILATFDLSSVDSVISVGGDGFYHEVVNGLLLKLCKEADIDINDPYADLPIIQQRVGIIPCGTGNGVAKWTYGSYDFETAALSIIIGKSNPNNVFGVYSYDEFVAFSILQVGYIYWSDVIYTCENRRNLGVWRYPVTLVGSIFQKLRKMNLRIQYLTSQEIGETENGPSTGNLTEENTNTATTTKDQTSDSGNKKVPAYRDVWKTVEGRYSSVVGMGVADFFHNGNNSLASISTRLVISSSNNVLNLFGILYKVVTASVIENREGDLTTDQAREFKVKLLDEWADSEPVQVRQQCGLNIDGEYVQLKYPQFHAKIHVGKFPLFTNAGFNKTPKK